MSRTSKKPPALLAAVAMVLLIAAVILGMTGVITSREMVAVAIPAVFLVTLRSWAPWPRVALGAALALAGGAGVVLAARRGDGWPILLGGALFAAAGALGLLSGIAALQRRRRTAPVPSGATFAPPGLSREIPSR